MLTDISNSVNNTNINTNLNTHVSNGSLKPLKIVSRTNHQLYNDENRNPILVKLNNVRKQSKFNNKSNISKINTDNNLKMLEIPNYRFNKIINNENDVIFPFYECPLKTDNIYKNNELKLDFTGDITFFKNVTKKYCNPIKFKYIKQENVTNMNDDPMKDFFMHGKDDNKIKFGDNVVLINGNGTHSMIRDVEFQSEFGFRECDEIEYNENDEILYASDEDEVSRLENSDLDGSIDKDESESDEDISSNNSNLTFDLDLVMDMDMDMDMDNNSYKEEEEDDDDNELISQNISSSFVLDNLNEFKKATMISPTKRTVILSSNKNHGKSNNIMSRVNDDSPKKQETILRKLKNNSSPIKNLKTHRSGNIINSIKKPNRTNYSKWDSSMTISAKAIMKMVDDSLVSSDTEVYNHSYSYLAIKNSNNKGKSLLDNISINAADLMCALNDEEGDVDLDNHELVNQIQGLEIK